MAQLVSKVSARAAGQDGQQIIDAVEITPNHNNLIYSKRWALIYHTFGR